MSAKAEPQEALERWENGKALGITHIRALKELPEEKRPRGVHE